MLGLCLLGHYCGSPRAFCMLDAHGPRLLGLVLCLARCSRSIAATACVAVMVLWHLAIQCATGDILCSSSTVGQPPWCAWPLFAGLVHYLARCSRSIAATACVAVPVAPCQTMRYRLYLVQQSNSWSVKVTYLLCSRRELCAVWQGAQGPSQPPHV